MKSVVHVGLVAPGLFSSEAFLKAFMDNGFQSYYLFDWQLEMFTYGKERMQIRLIELAEKIKPDLVFMHIQSSDIMDVNTFKQLKQISFTVNYTFDIRTPEQTEWLYKLVRHTGLVCFSNQRDVDICLGAGYKNVMVLQSSCDMELYKPDDSRRLKSPLAVFIGNNSEAASINFPGSRNRSIMVDRLRKTFHPEQFHVYGLGWGTNFLRQQEESKAYQYASIGVCQNQFDAPMYTSDRIWRVMASGCLCLTQKFDGVDTLFKKGVHLDWWENITELIDLLHHYLDHPKHAAEIAINGMNLVRNNHTWSARIGQLMNQIRSMMPSKPENPCLDAHRIDGIIPEPTDQQFDGRTCDCKKLIWKWTECGCVNKEYQLRAFENV